MATFEEKVASKLNEIPLPAWEIVASLRPLIDAEVAALTAERDAARAQVGVVIVDIAKGLDNLHWNLKTNKEAAECVRTVLTTDHQAALDKYVESKTADLRGKLERVKVLIPMVTWTHYADHDSCVGCGNWREDPESHDPRCPIRELRAALEGKE